MDLAAFHRGLFGLAPKHTPKLYRVTARQRRLYEAFPEARGFTLTAKQAERWRNQEHLLAALVVTLAQARPGEKRNVSLLSPRHYQPWIKEQIQLAGRYAARCRRKDRDALLLLRDVFRQITLRNNFAEIDEPEHWAAFGFRSDGVMPDWIRARLIEGT